MTPSSRSPRRPVRVALALAAAGAGIALAASASAASAACTAPATDAPGGKCRVTFTSKGNFAVPAGVTTADVLVVGGGGGGSTFNGGGGGQVVVKPGAAVTPGGSVAVTVGAGGASGVVFQLTGDGGNGYPSSFGSLTAEGGFGAIVIAGGASGTFTGGAFAFTQAGDTYGGGGAGAAGNGVAATTTACGAGGPGVDVSSTFPGLSPATFGGGGGSGSFEQSQFTVACAPGVGGGGTAMGGSDLAKAGLANSGGGGGAGLFQSPDVLSPGGSGLVVVQYTPVASAPTVTATVLVPRKKLVTGQATKLAIRATNTGTIAASGVVSCVAVPANLVVTRAAGGTRTKSQVCFTVGDLAAGATATRTITVRAVALRKVTRTVGGNVTATGVTEVAVSDPVSVTIRPRAVRPAVTG